MAWPKVLMEIQGQLTRIEAKLDILLPEKIEPVVLTDEERAEMVAKAIDYDSYTVQEIIERVGSLTPEDRRLLKIYEIGHKGRKMAIAAMDG